MTTFYRFAADSDAWEYRGLGQVGSNGTAGALFTGTALVRDRSGAPVSGVKVALVNFTPGMVPPVGVIPAKVAETDENGIAQFVDAKVLNTTNLLFLVKSAKGTVSMTPLAGGTVDITIDRVPFHVSPIYAPVVMLSLVTVLAGAAYYLKRA